MTEVVVTSSTATVVVTANNAATVSVAGAAAATVNENQYVLVTNPTLQGVQSISSPDFVQFNTSAVATGAVGRLKWNDTDGTLDLGLKGGNVTLQVGQELNMLVKSSTNNGLLEGKVVYSVGSDGGNKTVAYALADSDVKSSTTFGVMTETATGGAKGFATVFGLVRDINTSHLVEGGAIWLSPTVAGEMTSTKPQAPQHLVYIGVCIRSHATTGVIFVNVQNGYELEELHNVRITNPQDGQTLKYQASTGLWING